MKLIKQITESPKDVNLGKVLVADLILDILLFAVKLAAFVIACKIFLR